MGILLKSSHVPSVSTFLGGGLAPCRGLNNWASKSPNGTVKNESA